MLMTARKRKGAESENDREAESENENDREAEQDGEGIKPFERPEG